MFKLLMSFVLLLTTKLIFAGTLSGKIGTLQNKEVAYATVYLKGTAWGTITDVNGHFTMNVVPPGEYLLVVTCVGYADYEQAISISAETATVSVVLEESVLELDDVTVQTSTFQKEQKEQSISVTRADKVFLEENLGGSVMQTLKALPGVSSIEMGSGVAKPVIRGMSFNRVVVINNGIKQEGQQWGETHGLEVDQFGIGSVEIIKGPASIMYGSDAIAGVLKFSPSPILAKNTHTGEVKLIGKSNNQLIGGTAGSKGHWNKYFYNIRVSHQEYADYKIPAEEAEYNSYVLVLDGALKNTAGNESGICVDAGRTLKNGKTYVELSHVRQKSGFYADAHGQELRSTDINHDADNRDIHLPYQYAGHSRISSHTCINEENYQITFNIGYQCNKRIDYAELTDITGISESIPADNIDSRLDLHILSENISVKKELGNSELTIGNGTQFFNNTISGFCFVIPEYRKVNTGLFAYNRYEFGKELFLNIGLRYDYGFIQIDEYVNPRKTTATDSIYAVALEKQYHSVTGMIGVAKSLGEHWQVKANAGKSFRTPTAMELGANGMIKSSYRFEHGDPDLDPESAYQLDFLLKYAQSNFEASISPFYSYFTNYIYLNPSGQFNDISGAGQVYQYSQAQASRTGMECQLDYRLKKYGEISVSGEYVEAVNLDNGYPLPFTPPLSVNAKVKAYVLSKSQRLKKSSLFVGCRYYHTQERVIQNEKATPSSSIYSAGATMNFKHKKTRFKLSCSVENLLGTKYYNHLSVYRRLNIPEAGRNVILTLTMPFGRD